MSLKIIIKSKMICGLIIAIIFIFVSCRNKKVENARKMADQLWVDVEQGGAEKDFPEARFPRHQLKLILSDLKDKCDFKNRKGGYVKEVYQKDMANSNEKVSFVYDYFLTCDSVRFTLTYSLADKIELFEFRMDPIEPVK